MRMQKYLFFYSFINVLTFFPYILLVVYGANYSWYPMLFFYVMTYTANFWAMLFDFFISSSLLSMRICLLIGLIGSLLLFFDLGFVLTVIGATLLGVCVNFSSFLSGQLKNRFKQYVLKSTDVLQVIETLLITFLGFVLLTQSVKYCFLLLTIGFVFSWLCLIGIYDKNEAKIARLKVNYSTFPKSLGLFFITSLLFLLKLSRSTSLKVDTGVLLNVAIMGILINLIGIKSLKERYIDETERIFFSYSFIQGSLSTLCILYVSFSTMMVSGLNTILYNLSLPIILAVITALFLGERLLGFSPRVVLIFNVIGLLIITIPSLTSIGTFLSFFSNLILMGSVRANYVINRGISPRTIHFFSKIGSLIAQSWLVLSYLFAAETHGNIETLMKELGVGGDRRFLEFLEVGLIMALVIITVQFIYLQHTGKGRGL
ncbi:hypothetical protein LACDD01_01805 [Lactococcus sp. DD01]|nr:hypothetical protein LACDD01_01805 [Lactococcus sp. DD01]